MKKILLTFLSVLMVLGLIMPVSAKDLPSLEEATKNVAIAKENLEKAEKALEEKRVELDKIAIVVQDKYDAMQNAEIDSTKADEKKAEATKAYEEALAKQKELLATIDEVEVATKAYEEELAKQKKLLATIDEVEVATKAYEEALKDQKEAAAEHRKAEQQKIEAEKNLKTVKEEIYKDDIFDEDTEKVKLEEAEKLLKDAKDALNKAVEKVNGLKDVNKLFNAMQNAEIAASKAKDELKKLDVNSYFNAMQNAEIAASKAKDELKKLDVNSYFNAMQNAEIAASKAKDAKLVAQKEYQKVLDTQKGLLAEENELYNAVRAAKKALIEAQKVLDEVKKHQKPSKPTINCAGEKDKNCDGIVTCEEEMGQGWTWNESKKACVFTGKGTTHIVNTSTR